MEGARRPFGDDDDARGCGARRQRLGEQPLAPARVYPDRSEVAAASDVLSIHLALCPETRGLVDAAVLSALKPGSYLINTARAEVVDDDALAQAIRERGLRVGLDVFKGEPPAPSRAPPK